jgi:hypothetical protein
MRPLEKDWALNFLTIEPPYNYLTMMVLAVLKLNMLAEPKVYLAKPDTSAIFTACLFYSNALFV